MFSYDWNFSRIVPYFGAFANGLTYTISLSLVVIVLSTVLGTFWGVGLYRSLTIRSLTFPIVDALKALPPLVIILFGYFFFSKDVIGISIPAFWTFVISLGLNLGAFIADLTRAAISNTPRDYLDTANSLGVSEDVILRRILFPLAIRELIPPLSYLYIEAIKLTSLASVISVKETVYVAQAVVTETSRSLEVWVIVGAIYLVLILPATYLARKLEGQLKREVGLSNART
jgi:polar amino acid transport system permease protein